MHRLNCCVAVAIVGLGGQAVAGIINVPADELTIQAGIDAAVKGDEVVVAPGTYNESIDFNGKTITLRSSEGPDVTIIDAAAAFPFFTVRCNSDEGPDTLFQGFTVTGASTSGLLVVRTNPTVLDCVFSLNQVAGFEITEGNPSIMDCLFTGNGVRGLTVSSGNASVANCSFVGNGGPSSGGGGLLVGDPGNPTIVNCTFIGNEAEKGGAIYTLGANPIVIDCVFRDNSATEFGGAVYNQPGGDDPTFVNCEFIGNNALLAGGTIFNSRSNAMFINCTVSGSTAGLGGAMFNENFSFPIVTNCVFWDNSPGQFFDDVFLTTALYSNIQGGWPGIGNVDINPLFVDPANGDYHLQASSPLIDAGHNWAIAGITDTDLDGNPRFADDPATADTGCGVPVVVDMGAFEFQGTPATVKLGDIDGDGAVAVPDLLTLLAAWGPASVCQLADFDLDDLVGVPDLLILLANWE